MTRVRAHRLAAAIDDAVSAEDRPRVFGRVVDAFTTAWPLEYAILVAWEENGTDGSIELERGESTIPEPELTSWLLREAESGADLIADDGSQLGRPGSSIALPLRRENTALVGFLVLGGSGHPPRTWSPPPEPRSTDSVSLSPRPRSHRASGTWLR